MLWKDQVAFAETLVEKRKTLSSMLAIVVGLGVFRIQFTQKADEVPAVSGIALALVQWVLLAALLAFMIGAYFLYTQRPNFRRLGHWSWDQVSRYFKYLWKLARAPTPVDANNVTKNTPGQSPWPAGRAIRLILPDEEVLSDWFIQLPAKAVQIRAERLREAYRSLVEQNKRVSDRLRTALFWLFLGCGLVFVALAVYILSMGNQI